MALVKSMSRYATASDVAILTVSFLSAICGGALIPIMPLIFSRFAQSFLKVGDESTAPVDASLDHNTLYFVYLAVAEFVFISINTFGFMFTGERITRRLREAYLAALLRQEISFFGTMGVGECTAGLTTDINIIQKGISEKVARTIHALSTFCAAFIVGFVLCWQLTLTLTWSVGLVMALMATGIHYNRIFTRNLAQESSSAIAVAAEAVSSIRIIKALGAEDRLASKYRQYLNGALRWGTRQKVSLGITLGTVIGVNYLNIALVLWRGSHYLTEGHASFTDVLVIELVITSALYALTGISNHVETFTKALAALRKSLETIERDTKLDGTCTSGLKPSQIDGNIQLRNVTFSYPSRPENIVLDSLSITFPAGKTTAIVGSSGSGKSSIIDLLPRFYDPLAGEIFFDGFDLRNLNTRWLRQKIGIVNQNPVLFADSISENIRYGLIGTLHEQGSLKYQDELIKRAAIAANAHEFILRLPNGYDTYVGDKGSILSGGQRQRVAIARALVSNPKILLFDEATSAIDSESEKKIVAHLDSSKSSRTTILVAHRLSTIKSADNIIVMSHGRVIEHGTHDELLTLDQAYAGLVKAGTIDIKDELNPESESEDGEFDEIKDLPDINQLAPPPPHVEQIFTRPTTKSTLSYVLNSVEMSELHRHEKEVEVEPPALQPTSTEKKSSYTAWNLTKFAASFNRNEALINTCGLVCCILAGAEESVNAILFAQSTISLSLPPSRFSELVSKVGFWALMYLMLAIVQIVAFCGQGTAFAISSEHMIRRVKDLTFQKIIHQDVEYFDKTNTRPGALISMLSNDTTGICALSGATLGLLLIVVTTLISAFIIGCAFGWKLALVCSATVPIVLACGFLSVSLLSKFAEDTSEALLGAANQAVEAISEIKTVAILTREMKVLDGYKQSLNTLSQKSLKTNVFMSLLYALCQSMTYLCMALGFWYGGTLLARGEYSPLQFFVVFSSIIFGAKSAGVVFSFTDDISDALHAAERLKDLFSSRPTIECQTSEVSALSDIKGDIQFRDMVLKQPGTGHLVLNHVNLHINPGEHVAIVGPSGSGKSSIIALLERFYMADGGEIFVDGHNISKLPLKEYRNFLALVSQDVTLYEGTLIENIVLGVNGEVSDEDVTTACQISDLNDFISSLPDGLSTHLGTSGCMLSGGQKQRVSIARAVLRKPKILLLDEATSALDPSSETAVQKALDKAGAGRTTITVAHRLNTIRGADKIYFLENGNFVEQGSHTGLMALKGRYFEFVKLQEMHER